MCTELLCTFFCALRIGQCNISCMVEGWLGSAQGTNLMCGWRGLGGCARCRVPCVGLMGCAAGLVGGVGGTGARARAGALGRQVQLVGG